ncbi:MAG TPA: uracil-DNA glycosylase [Anaerolineae bacterium]
MSELIFKSLSGVNTAVVACRQCARLVEYRERVAREKRRAFRDDEYWGRPVPGWGDPHARILIVGLAPAAHGGNRTGRMFTGDSSGNFLYRALHQAGMANQPDSVSRTDGLSLADVYITASARCAPPDNKPTREEFDNCRPYLIAELRLLKKVRVIIALGQIAFENALLALAANGEAMPQPRPKFGHARVYSIGAYTLIASYHPSQRNTQTGLLTRAMFDRVFRRARLVLEK